MDERRFFPGKLLLGKPVRSQRRQQRSRLEHIEIRTAHKMGFPGHDIQAGIGVSRPWYISVCRLVTVKSGALQLPPMATSLDLKSCA